MTEQSFRVTDLHPKDASLCRRRTESLWLVFPPLAHRKTLLFTSLMIGCLENMARRLHCFLGPGADCMMFSPVVPCRLSPFPRCPRSSLNSVNSSDSRSSGSHGSHSHSPSSHYRYRGSSLAQQAPVRLSSVSSHDSGFISQDAFQSKSPSPMPPEAPNQVRVLGSWSSRSTWGLDHPQWLEPERDLGLDRPLSSDGKPLV